MRFGLVRMIHHRPDPAPVLRALGATARTTGAALRVVTVLGWTCCGLGLACGVAGWLLGWRELWIVAVTCGTALLLAVPFTLGTATVEVTVELPGKRLVAGNPAACALVARNISTRRLGRLVIQAPIRQVLGGPRVGDPVTAILDCPTLDVGVTRTGPEATIPTTRRGVIMVGPAVSVRGDPLGLLRRTMSWAEPIEILVHPRTARITPTGAGLLRDLEGQTSNDLSMNDVAFHALREYAPGDDLRHVHALTSARMGRLMVRQFVDTRTAHLAVVVSGAVAEYRDVSEFETALSVGGSIALRAVDDAQRVCVLAADRFTETRAARSRRVLLDGLTRAVFGATGTDIAALATRVTRLAPATSLVVLVAGGASTVADFRPAAARFGVDVRVVVLRIDAGEPPGIRRVGQLSVVTIPALGALRTGLRAAM